MSKKTLTGTVVSTKMVKTVVVSVELPKKHPIYGKTVKNTRRFKARAEEPIEALQEGDTVVIEESRPFSKDVSWIVTKKVIEE
jgi:small subunit ribosomal protein S17